MGQVERVGVEEDAAQVPLPDNLRVLEGALRFHLPGDDGKPVCDRREIVGEAPIMRVAEARENHGLTACRSCFTVRGQELPEEVVVALGTDAETYHAPAQDGERECNYGPYGSGEEPVVVTVARQKAEKAGLDPCKGCFGAAGEVSDPCPLCEEPLNGTGLRHHLATPDGEGCPYTPQGVGKP